MILKNTYLAATRAKLFVDGFGIGVCTFVLIGRWAKFPFILAFGILLVDMEFDEVLFSSYKNYYNVNNPVSFFSFGSSQQKAFFFVKKSRVTNNFCCIVRSCNRYYFM